MMKDVIGDETVLSVESHLEQDVSRQPMLYSASTIELIEDLKARLDRNLRRFALERAREDHRTLIGEEDVRAIVQAIGGPILEDADVDG